METLWFEELVQDIFSLVKKDKSSYVDMKNEDLLIKRSNEDWVRSKERGGMPDNHGRSWSMSRVNTNECYNCKKKGLLKRNCL